MFTDSVSSTFTSYFGPLKVVDLLRNLHLDTVKFSYIYIFKYKKDIYISCDTCFYSLHFRLSVSVATLLYPQCLVVSDITLNYKIHFLIFLLSKIDHGLKDLYIILYWLFTEGFQVFQCFGGTLSWIITWIYTCGSYLSLLSVRDAFLFSSSPLGMSLSQNSLDTVNDGGRKKPRHSLMCHKVSK